MTIPRYRLLVAYDGTAYHGFQTQRRGLDTVAARLEAALGRICPEGEAAGGRITVAGASRTDAGVHARGQVCAFSSRTTVPVERLSPALGSLLPADIVVLKAERAAAGFDPRGEAVGKTYAYRIWRSAVPSPFFRDWVLHLRRPLDLAPCREALRDLVGRHDFVAFRDAGSATLTTVRTIERVTLESRPLPRAHPAGGELVTLRITGDGFLYHMVRIIVGTVLEIGRGRRPPDTFREALDGGSRLRLGPTAPARGLRLETVFYPEDLATGGGFGWSEDEAEDLTLSPFGSFRFP